MSPRHNRRRGGDADEAGDAGPIGGGQGGGQGEEWHGVAYVTRRVVGSATKFYRCPGCDQEIAQATPHVVAWPAEGGSVEDRRHWHSACWSARERRGVKVHRSKNAPHYG